MVPTDHVNTSEHGFIMLESLEDVGAASRGVPTLLVLELTSLRSVTNLALIVPSFVFFLTKNAHEQLLVG